MSFNYFNLKTPLSLARLVEPMTALGFLQGLIVIDEIQLTADLFPVLRVLIDRHGFQGQFLLFWYPVKLLRQSLDSLAGRQETLSLRCFGL